MFSVSNFFFFFFFILQGQPTLFFQWGCNAPLLLLSFCQIPNQIPCARSDAWLKSAVASTSALVSCWPDHPRNRHHTGFRKHLLILVWATVVLGLGSADMMDPQVGQSPVDSSFSLFSIFFFFCPCSSLGQELIFVTRFSFFLIFLFVFMHRLLLS